MQEGQVISLSPSFSDDKLAGIAARVVNELDSDELHGVDADDFDFSFVTSTTCSAEPSSADEIFKNGKIRPVYPVVKAIDPIEKNDDRNLKTVSSDRPRTRHPLSSLFSEETETAAAAVGRWKKSASAGGGSKRWTLNLKSIMRRSNSYGSKDSSALADRKDHEKKAKPAPAPAPSIRDGGGEKLRSYLPYRLDLVGYFGNVNAMRKT